MNIKKDKIHIKYSPDGKALADAKAETLVIDLIEFYKMLDYIELGRGKFKTLEPDITEARAEELKEEIRKFNLASTNGIYRQVSSNFLKKAEEQLKIRKQAHEVLKSNHRLLKDTKKANLN